VTTDSGVIGAVLGRYILQSVIARGGQATVYLGRHQTLPREVAVKVFHRHVWEDGSFRVRFRREYEALVALEHPNIVPVYDAGVAEGRGYLVMRLARGGSLSGRLALGPLPPAEAAAVLGQVAAALDAAHSAGRLHRDLKPGNVLLDPGGHVWLADFGVARALAATPNTADGLLVGTPAYLAPEVIEGAAASAAADRYALACLAFEVLTGGPPFSADRLEGLLWAHVHRDAPLASERRPGLPSGVDLALLRGMAKDPGRRPPSAAALAAELAAAAEPTRAMTAVTLPLPRGARPAHGRRRRRAAAASGLVLAACAGALWFAGVPGGSDHAARRGGTGATAPRALPEVPGPTGTPLAAARARPDDLPGLSAGTWAAAAEQGGVRIAAVAGSADVGVATLASRVRAELEARGLSVHTLVDELGAPVGLLAVVDMDLSGVLPRWALLAWRGANGRPELLVAQGRFGSAERYVYGLVGSAPERVLAP
jgi:serine/threonine-protein kinase